jgi:hypothetical protein
MLRGQRPVLVGVVPEVGQTHVSTNDQHLGSALERIADFAKEFVLGPHPTGVVPADMDILMNGLFLHMLGIKLSYLRCVVVDKGDGVKETHVKVLLKWGWRELQRKR